nr:Chain A, Cathelicidin antimicrobial peptide [Homo sapiens]7NPQ_B Chain B, Cathelicidin antimicrobial peptide [Homo sapiens]
FKRIVQRCKDFLR